jgi:hypothetical protein
VKRSTPNAASFSRRNFLAGTAAFGVAGFLGSASRPVNAADELVELPFANGRRELASNFPQKGPMILQRTRPPLLETPFEVFDQGVFTPNDRFYVRWHLPNNQPRYGRKSRLRMERTTLLTGLQSSLVVVLSVTRRRERDCPECFHLWRARVG